MIHGPDWGFEPHEGEDITGYCPDPEKGCDGYVSQCAWLDDRRIAYWMTVDGSDELSRIEVIDVDTREISTLAEFASNPGLGLWMDIFALRDGGLIVYNEYRTIPQQEPPYEEVSTTPGLIRVADGTQQSILRERDDVVAVVPGGVADARQHRVPG